MHAGGAGLPSGKGPRVAPVEIRMYQPRMFDFWGQGFGDWRHAFGDVVPSVLLAFQGGAQGFSTAGVPIDRDAFVAEVGADYAVSSSVRVGVSASSQIGSRASDYAFKGHIEVSF
jgi:outer membrane autotransporter protein